MNGLLVATALFAPASPVPVPAGQGQGGNVDRNQAQNFARVVYQLAMQVRDRYAEEKKEHDKQLIEGAIRGLYEAAGVEMPEKVKAAIRQASGPTQLIEVLTDARVRLGNDPKLSGAKSIFAALNGFKHATDPSCSVVGRRASDYASIDQDFGVGIELEGVVGQPWTLYQVESSIASGRLGAIGWFGPMPRVEDIPIPATFPWRVRRVIPGSPAQKAGVLPGDVITHLDGTEITAETANKLFFNFAVNRQAFDPRTGQPISPDRNITFQRDGGKPFTANLKGGTYVPESAFGVLRLPEDKWDCMLDRKYKIGYIRLGPVEMGLDTKVAEMMEGLTKQGCRALILDLRWCPGGHRVRDELGLALDHVRSRRPGRPGDDAAGGGLRGVDAEPHALRARHAHVRHGLAQRRRPVEPRHAARARGGDGADRQARDDAGAGRRLRRLDLQVLGRRRRATRGVVPGRGHDLPARAARARARARHRLLATGPRRPARLERSADRPRYRLALTPHQRSGRREQPCCAGPIRALSRTAVPSMELIEMLEPRASVRGVPAPDLRCGGT